MDPDKVFAEVSERFPKIMEALRVSEDDGRKIGEAYLDLHFPGWRMMSLPTPTA